MKLLRTVALVLCTVLSQAQAQSLVLPAGIAVDPDSSLDLTYQVVSGYDPVEKVVAGWMEDKLQYFVTVQRLPPEWIDHNKYFAGLLRDMRAAGRIVEAGSSGTYKAASALTGHYLLIQSKTSPKESPASQVVHFISDGKVAFLAIATLTEKGAEGRMLQETKLLFQSASLPTGVAPESSAHKAESPYVGTWKWSGSAPNGSPAASTMMLKDDLSFAAEVSMGGKLVFAGVGVWHVSGRKLSWRYLRSEPQLPEDKRDDEDEIVANESGRLVLRSKLSGIERVFLLQ